MQHECKITVIDKKCFTDYQEQYLADPKSGPCPCFNVGDEFILKRTPQQDDFYHLMNGKFCGEAWDAISRYVYTALQGGSIMKGWTNDDRMMIACHIPTRRNRRTGGWEWCQGMMAKMVCSVPFQLTVRSWGISLLSRKQMCIARMERSAISF